MSIGVMEIGKRMDMEVDRPEAQRRSYTSDRNTRRLP